MRLQPEITDDHTLVIAARDVADELLNGHFRLGITKALNLETPASFDRAVARLAAQLRSRALASDHAAVKSAVEALDIDWRQTTADQRRALISRALQVAGQKTSGVPRKVDAVFGKAADEVVRAGRDGARHGQRLAIAAEFNALDHRVVRHLRSSQANYVRDEYGRRHEAFGKQARRIVADGLEAGLGRADMARDLQAAAEGIIAGRSSFYWEVIAGSFVGRGRSFAQLSAYAEAGLQRYRIAAVLDEVTTPACRFLDGKTLSVSRGLELFDRVEAAPDRIEELSPWVREQNDPRTGQRSLYVERGGDRVVVADIARRSFGTRDDRGEFSGGLGARELADLGIGFPPYHGLCRTTTLGEG